MAEHAYGWFSLAPPVVAITLAIATRRVIASLLAGVFVGSLLVAAGRPQAAAGPLHVLVRSLTDLGEVHLWGSLKDEAHLRVFAFTLLMGAMIGVVHQAGGMQAVVRRLAPWARSRRGGQLLTWVLGLLIFFDDYANTLLLGNTMRPLCDRLRISREKLAYIVDSTAAPVAGLALISTWVAGEIGYIESGYRGLPGLPGPVDGLGVFVETIPYRFYVLLALVFVPLTALLGRDFGPMWAAERRAAASGGGEGRSVGAPRATGDGGGTGERLRLWLCGAVPLLATIGATLALLLATGWGAAPLRGGWRAWIAVFGAGDSYVALLYGSLAGWAAALAAARGTGALTAAEARAASLRGATLVMPALAVLWLAWALSALTAPEYLGTGQFLAESLRRALAPQWMPTVVFLLASFVSFATGTSWGTMGILMPLVVRVTWHMLHHAGAPPDPHHPVLVASIGGVLAGAIFGDHCSPISDTTILSSQASGCDHVAHVWTQLPYALIVALAALVCGTIPAGWGWSPWVLLPAGAAALWLTLRWLGRPVLRGP